MVVFKHIDLLHKTMNLYTNALSKNFAFHFEALLAVQLPKFDPVLHTRVATMKWFCCTSVTCNEIITFFRNSSFAHFLGGVGVMPLVPSCPCSLSCYFPSQVKILYENLFSKAYFLELDILSLMDQSPLPSETHF